MKLLSILLAAIFSLALVETARAEEPKHTSDTLETVQKNLKDGKAILVDVREQKEWDEGHIAGAFLVPKSKLIDEKEAEKIIKDLPKGKIIYTHCRAGRRALDCGEILKKHGFDARALKAGYEELVKAGFDKTK